jgi:hypothetical protein
MELYEYVMRKLSRSAQVPIEVALAMDGFDALEQLSKGRYDLVVTAPVHAGAGRVRVHPQDEAGRTHAAPRPCWR